MKLGGPVGRPGVAALALLVALPSLRNGFVYDDVPAIVENPLLHSLGGSSRVWVSSYWPLGLLYRPVTSQLFALEWWLGGGAAWPFHLVNLLLYALVTLLVCRIASRLLAPAGALAAAALFAVHPVHVEVVANGVGQSELLVALFGLAAVDRYLAWRPTGFGAGRRVSLALLCLLAIGAKETGYVVPFLLGLLELSLRERGTRPNRELGALSLLLAASVVIGLLVRVLLFSSLKGESATLPLRPFGLAERAVVMLAAVPQWLRLLLWPAHLRAHYGPPELPVTPTLGAAHILGLLLLGAAGALLWWSWRRARVVALGLLWLLIALAPVSNVLTATGVIVAERTLFLPSVGLVLALGAVIAWLAERTPDRGSRRTLLTAALLTLLTAGAWRSLSRTTAWRSQEDFFAQLRRDAPRSYRAQFSAGSWYLAQRRFADAEPALAAAHALYRDDPAVYETYGQLFRVQQRCDRALPIFSEGLARHPAATTLRSRLIECALALGDSARARAVAAEAVALGQPEFQHTLERLDRRAP